MVNLTYKGNIKPVRWVGSSKKELLSLPEDVINEVGFALWQAQKGGHYVHSKPLKGLGSGVREIVIDYDKDTYRAVYVVNLGDAVFVLHVFQKKSKHGIKTPKGHLELIKQRLKIAKEVAAKESKQ